MRQVEKFLDAVLVLESVAGFHSLLAFEEVVLSGLALLAVLACCLGGIRNQLGLFASSCRAEK